MRRAPCQRNTKHAYLVRRRFLTWAEEELLDARYGFRRRRQCRDANFVLRRLVDHQLIRGKELFVCFIGITKAYDSVDRKTAWETLIHRGAPPKLVHVVRDMHEDNSCAIRISRLGLGEESI